MRKLFKKFLKLLPFIVSIFVIIFLLTSCIGYVKVLLVVPLSSDLSAFGKDVENAVLMKISEVNKEGGVLGKRIRVDIFDDKNDPEYAAEEASKVLSRNNFIAVVGAPFSRIAVPLSDVCENLKIPFITPVATNPSVTLNKQYSFRACFTDYMQGNAAAHFVFDYLKLKKGGIIYDISDPYSSFLAEAFKNSFESLGGKVVAYYPHPREPISVEYPVEKMLEQRVEFVFNPDLYVDASMIYTELRKQNFTGPIIFGDGVDAPQFLSRVPKPYDCFYITHYSIDNPDLLKFMEKYIEIYKTEPSVEAYLSYDAMGLLVEAIKKANSFQKDQIRNALRNLAYNGITGVIQFKDSNDPIKPVYVYGFDNFKPKLIWEFTNK